MKGKNVLGLFNFETVFVPFGKLKARAAAFSWQVVLSQQCPPESPRPTIAVVVGIDIRVFRKMAEKYLVLKHNIYYDNVVDIL
jgi:hypothetical protein